jgi:hypothetical protein
LIENRTYLKASAHSKDSIYPPEEQKISADVEADFFKKGETVQLYNAITRKETGLRGVKRYRVVWSD